MFSALDAELVKALSSAGAAALMFLVVVMLIWAASRGLGALREITSSFLTSQADQSKRCAEEHETLTGRLFTAIQSFQTQIESLAKENRSTVQSLGSTVESLGSTVQSLGSTVESLRTSVENRLLSPKRGD